MPRTNAAVLPPEGREESDIAGCDQLHRDLRQDVQQPDVRGEGAQERDAQRQDAQEQDEPRSVPSDARLWGFVRRGKVESQKGVILSESDVSLWLDQQRCRFLVVAEKVVKDDLAPVEFVQFVRELRHSTSQVLFKFEILHDGKVGRPFCVWPS
jgi:hypothetical protein